MSHNQSYFEGYSFEEQKKFPDEIAKKTHFVEQGKVEGKKFTFIDLFCGIGGIRKAFQNAGATCLFSCDKDPFARQTYYANFGVLPYGDITSLSQKKIRIPKHTVLCAGFPCQPFSHIGKREGFSHPTQGTMFYEILKIVERKKPKIVFLENVPGMKNHDQGKTLHVILESLKDLGYECSHEILNSADFGVPQSRKRFYLVGVKSKRRFKFSPVPDIHVDIGPILEKNVKGYSISKHLQKSYMYKIDDGRPLVIDHLTAGPTKTLVASYHKIQRLTGTFVKDGPTGLRLLTKNECKILMGFEKEFHIPVSRTQMYRQMGNSVVIPVVQHIANDIKKFISQK